jgi:hypothetical protein
MPRVVESKEGASMTSACDRDEASAARPGACAVAAKMVLEPPYSCPA